MAGDDPANHIMSKIASSERGADSVCWVINAQSLHVGDVLLSAADEKISKGIRFATGGAFSHASIHIGGGYLIEAVREGVHKIFSRAIAFDARSQVAVFRPIGISPDGLEDVARSARALNYRPYSIRGALGTMLSHRPRARSAGKFCSQLVAEAFDSAGHPLSELNPAKIIPDAIRMSPLLEDVSETVIRSVERRVWQDVVTALDPKSYSVGTDPARSLTPRQFEYLVYETARPHLGKRLSAARHAGHFFDILRHLTNAFGVGDQQAQSGDDWLYELMSRIEARYPILGRGVAEGLIERRMMWDLDSRDLDTKAKVELQIVLRELYAGREWNTQDRWDSATELRTAAEATNSKCAAMACGYAYRDAAVLDDEYRMIGAYLQP